MLGSPHEPAPPRRYYTRQAGEFVTVTIADAYRSQKSRRCGMGIRGRQGEVTPPSARELGLP